MNPIEQLYEEHQNILRGIKLLEKTVVIVSENNKIENEIELLISFFRNYADTGHHEKEEDVLFRMLIETNPALTGEFSPIGSLKSDHIEGRRLISTMVKQNNLYGDYSIQYSDMIKRHIEIEDELFPMLIENNLDEVQILKLQTLFGEADIKNRIFDHLRILDRLEMELS